MSRSTATYTVYRTMDGAKVADGTTEACAAQMGIDVGTFRNACSHASYGKNKKYRFVCHSPYFDAKKILGSPELAQARKWDQFCEPIRRYFSIPVRRLP